MSFMPVVWSHYDSPVGDIRLYGHGDALVGVRIAGQTFTGEAKQIHEGESPVFKATRRWLDDYFCGRWRRPDGLTLQPRGTDFQRRVWRLLYDIPWGQTRTYGQIATQIEQQQGGRMAAQAVGSAVGKNPISLIIGCHRVIGSDGSLTGYAGGIALKRWLLHHEGAL